MGSDGGAHENPFTTLADVQKAREKLSQEKAQFEAQKEAQLCTERTNAKSLHAMEQNLLAERRLVALQAESIKQERAVLAKERQMIEEQWAMLRQYAGYLNAEYARSNGFIFSATHPVEEVVRMVQ